MDYSSKDVYKLINDNQFDKWFDRGCHFEMFEGKPMIVKNDDFRYGGYGVYIIYVRDVPVYIGMGKHVDDRLAQHWIYINSPDMADREACQSHRIMYRVLYPIRNEIVFEIYGTYKNKKTTDEVEDELINKFDPAFNIRRKINGKHRNVPNNITSTQKLLEWISTREPILQRPYFELIDSTGRKIKIEYEDAPIIRFAEKMENGTNGISTGL